MISEVLVYIPEMKEFLYASEGTGDNLLDEDIEQGYMDYVNINTYAFDNPGFIEKDGGQMMLTELFINKYGGDNGTQLIEDAIRFIYEMDFDYVVLEKE